MKHIFDINTVQPGMKVYSNIVDPKSRITLVSSGTILSEELIKRLQMRDIYEISVDLTEPEKQKYQFDFNVIPTVGTTIVKRTAAALKRIDGIKPIADNLIQDTLDYAQKIVDSVLMDANFTYRLTDYKMNAEQTEHSVRTATYAVALANAYNNSIKKDLRTSEEVRERTIDLKNIATAALLHDIGRLCKDDKVRYGIKDYIRLGSKFPGLSKEKYVDLKENYDPRYDSYYGYNIIHDHSTLDGEVKVMVLFSNEDNIGSGPLGLKFEESPLKHIVAAKIINLCSQFDKYLMKNIKEEVTLENTFEAFRDSFTKGKFEKYLSDLFFKTIPLYPLGTKVLLHGDVNSYAIVARIFTDEDNYSKPTLITIPDKKIVDLRKTTKTTVEKVVGDEVKMYELLFNSLETPEPEQSKRRA